MDEALVEDAEHDIDDQHGDQQQDAESCSETWKACAVPCRPVFSDAGRRSSLRSRLGCGRPPGRAKRRA